MHHNNKLMISLTRLMSTVHDLRARSRSICTLLDKRTTGAKVHDEFDEFRWRPACNTRAINSITHCSRSLVSTSRARARAHLLARARAVLRTDLFVRKRERVRAAVICISIQFRLAYLKEKTCPSLGARTLLVNVGR